MGVILHQQTSNGNAMTKRVRITNDRLNSYGTRVLTSGMDIEQYKRNPVLLYMHERGNVIGYVRDLKADADELTGELVFDEATELSVRCKKQFEFGSLKMVSAGLDIVEMSEDAAQLVEGQTSPTITRSKLFEVSLVDIGANDDAIVLQKDGKRITLGRDGACPLPLLNNEQTTPQEMETKAFALQLGLPETATEAEISTAIEELKAAKEQNADLLKEKEALRLAQIENLVDKAVSEKRLAEGNRAIFVELGKKVGADDLKEALGAMQPQVKLSAVINTRGEESGKAAFGKLSEVPAATLADIRENDLAEYKRLYKAEYGCEYEA